MIKDLLTVVADTTKVRIFKQITTPVRNAYNAAMLLLIPQRYEFSSKSQPQGDDPILYMLLLLIPQRYEFSSKSQRANVDKPASNGCC